MDIYSLVQKLPEELVGIIASYDPTKELKRKQLKKSFNDIHRVSTYALRIDNWVRSDQTIWEVYAGMFQLIANGHFRQADGTNEYAGVRLYRDVDWNRIRHLSDFPRPLDIDGDRLAWYAMMCAGLVGGVNRRKFTLVYCSALGRSSGFGRTSE